MSDLTVYLAGPYNNCNKKQQTEWRKEIKGHLKGHYKWIDPAEHVSGWTPLKEMVDIERSDLVIANLWRESIGTVVGVLQATRSGKPVILIDPNYIDSAVLRDLVGQDNVTHSISAAVNILDKHVAPLLRSDIMVEKKGGKIESFRYSKLQRSLNSVCAESQVNDAVLPVLVPHRVRQRIRLAASSGVIKSSTIADLIFEELQKVITEPDGRYSATLERDALVVREEWRKQKDLRDDGRVLVELSTRELEARAEIKRLIEENRELRSQLSSFRGTEETTSDETVCSHNTVAEAVASALIRFAEVLVFHEKALSSATDCPFVRGNDVYVALDLLAQYVQEKNQAAQQEEPEKSIGFNEWLRKRSPIKYAPTESKSTRHDRRAQAERTVNFAGRSYTLNKHLKFGVGNANECCRIHFEFIGKIPDLKALVGHVGKHLS